jgi:quercetin dioxygenase-like cupin family protein
VHKIKLAADYIDIRGAITDLVVGEITSVTHITFAEGAIRGNHYHKLTTQWKYILRGSLVMVTLGSEGKPKEVEGKAGDLFVSYPGEPHAMRAITSSEMIVITSGPRAGENYNDDTFNLKII